LTARADSAQPSCMPKIEKQRPAETAQGAAEAARREARLAEALRENLKRRKIQARERQTDEKKD
jgi:hypothetical protein